MGIEERKYIIERLEIMRGHGQFEGQTEDDMDFSKLSDEDLKYYSDEWLVGQFDEE
ncbi:hypothetical protein ACWN8V_07110 [Vagococcus elongatus]|uniref:hypothetical protein n=1 Tax=Vagococcus elongatus TaxID=180344 RepID=UPI001476F39A|nr:hypothetical protein [Vagococcus elongatus]